MRRPRRSFRSPFPLVDLICGRARGSGARTTKTIRSRSVASPHSHKRLRTWVGRMAVTCGWTFVGPAVTPIGYQRSRGSWSALQPDIILAITTPATLTLQRETRTIPIVFVTTGDPVASGIVARRDRLGTPPASAAWKPRWEASGLSCSRRSRLGSSGPQSYSIPTRPRYRLICPHLRRRHGYSRSCQSLRPFIATKRSKRPSRPWA